MAILLLLGQPSLYGQQPAGVNYQVDIGTSRVYARVDAASRLGHTHGVEGRLASGAVTLSGGGELVFDHDHVSGRHCPGAPVRGPGCGGAFGRAQGHVKYVGHGCVGRLALSASRLQYHIDAPLDGQAAGQPGRYQLDGRFTLHGVNQPVQFVATIEPADKSGGLRMRGTFTIRQTAFGIQPYSALAGLARVADPLPIWGDLVLYPAR